MFYLSFFFKVIAKKPVAAILWGISVLGMLTLSFYGRQATSFIVEKKTVQRDANPYFFALMPKTINTGYVQRKLKELPGVEKVFTLSEQKVSDQIKSILTASQIDWEDDIDLSYSGLKISISADLKTRSQDLIRNYLSRLAGKSDITMGAIKYPEVQKNQTPSLWSQYSFVWPALGVSLLYISAFALMYKSYSEESTITEYYQRKKQIFSKSICYSQAPLLIILMLGAVVFKQDVLVALAMVTGVLLTMMILGQRKRAC